MEAAAGGGVTSFRSILDKPLTQLTEEDISQLTREDCRKYLKEKGMRRPSWNKSQAIQQVISLKALLETSDDSGSGALPRILVSKPPPPPPPGTLSSANSAKELSVVSDDNRRNDSPKSFPPVAAASDCQPTEAADEKANAAPRAAVGGSASSAGQMTIFYCGKVNVYEGVPPEKARTIMHLAASPIQLPLDDPVARNTSFSCPSPVWSQSDKHDVVPHTCVITPAEQTDKMSDHPQICRERGNNISIDHDVEGQASRKVSLQRYLEKKRDRGKSKGRKTFGTPCSSLEMYLKVHHARTQATSGQSARISTSPTQPRANDQPKFANFSVDLNEDTQEC